MVESAPKPCTSGQNSGSKNKLSKNPTEATCEDSGKEIVQPLSENAPDTLQDDGDNNEVMLASIGDRPFCCKIIVIMNACFGEAWGCGNMHVTAVCALLVRGYGEGPPSYCQEPFDGIRQEAAITFQREICGIF